MIPWLFINLNFSSEEPEDDERPRFPFPVSIVHERPEKHQKYTWYKKNT